MIEIVLSGVVMGSLATWVFGQVTPGARGPRHLAAAVLLLLLTVTSWVSLYRRPADGPPMCGLEAFFVFAPPFFLTGATAGAGLVWLLAQARPQAPPEN
ncbi:MAG: hypothetical protein KC910_24710 [Candidatus Eremiobacteraeota bacterium]|nr:hypothetical protein [Candidatus Eremiobacteraeota bacterium]